MDDLRRKFDEFCASEGLEGTDRDFYFWLAALRDTWLQEPIAYGYFTPDGRLLQMLEFIEPNRVAKPTPLFAAPIADVPKPNVSDDALLYIWKTYYEQDNDLLGMLRWLEKFIKR